MAAASWRRNETNCNIHFMSETTSNWDDLRLFLAVARAGGLGPAARTTGKSAPTLGRRMLALERHLGRELFHRLPRGYDLTADGEALLAEVSAVEARINPLLSPSATAVAPLVKVSAGTWVTRLLATQAPRLLDDRPVRLRFIAADQRLDIARREAVIGVRNARPEGMGLAGRRVGRVRFAVYARDPDVSTWGLVMGNTPSAEWARRACEERPRIEITSPRNAMDLARSGAVRVVLPTFVGDAEPALVRVAGPIPELDHDQWLVTHNEDRYLPEVRRTVDRIYAVLRDAVRS